MEVDIDEEFGSPVGVEPSSSKAGGASWETLAAAAPAPARVSAPQGTQGVSFEPPLVDVSGYTALPGGEFGAEEEEEGEVGEQDLYGDLLGGGSGAGGTLLQTQLAELQDRTQRQEARIAELQQQVESLDGQKLSLEAQVAVLTTNISSLYDTAKLEIQRKTDEIKELREQLAQAQAQAQQAPRPQTAAGSRPSSQQQQQQQTGQQRVDHQQLDRQQRPHAREGGSREGSDTPQPAPRQRSGSRELGQHGDEIHSRWQQGREGSREREQQHGEERRRHPEDRPSRPGQQAGSSGREHGWERQDGGGDSRGQQGREGSRGRERRGGEDRRRREGSRERERRRDGWERDERSGRDRDGRR